MLNKIFIMGRLTRDPELRRTQSGLAVVSFSVAVDRDYQQKDGGEKQVDFFDVTAWRQTAEFISKYFAKGRMIVVEGKMQSRGWTDKNGTKRTSWEIIADNVYFGDSKRDGDGGAQTASSGSGSRADYSYGRPPVSVNAGFEEVDDNEDLPF